jgi:hypothetical protein
MEVIGKGPWRVTIIESDRFMGQKIDGYRRFETKEEAQNWVTKYNSQNDSDTVPEWYMYAQSPQHVL